MNISRYVNIDKFVNIRYIFISPSGIQLIISDSPNVEITSPGRRASEFFNPCLKTIIIKYNFKQYIHIHNKISQSEYNEYIVIIIGYFVLTLNNLYISF